MMRGLRYRLLATVILVVLSAASAAAQEFRATIRGQVLDSSKGALPGVIGHRAEHRHQRGCHGGLERQRQLHDPVPAARFLHTDVPSCRDSRSTADPD